MTNAAIDASMMEAEPPEDFPREMIDVFTYGGKGKVKIIPFSGGVQNQRYMGNNVDFISLGKAASRVPDTNATLAMSYFTYYSP